MFEANPFDHLKITEDQFTKLVGKRAPKPILKGQGKGYYAGHLSSFYDKDPILKWDGKNPQLKFKPWMRDLRLWYHATCFPPEMWGLKVMRSFDQDSWLKAAADMAPEEVLLSEQGYDAILRRIID